MSACLANIDGIHPVHFHLYVTFERSDLGTESLPFIKFFILNEEDTKFISTFLQYLLTNVCILRLVKLDKERYGNSK